MHADEIDVLGELWIALPDIERFGGRNRDLQLRAGTIDVVDQLVDADIAAQDRLVADHGAGDVVVLAGQRDQRLQFGLVVVHAPVDPRTRHDLHVVERGESRDLRAFQRGIGAQALGMPRQHADVAGQFGLAGEQTLGRILVTLEGVVGHAFDAATPVIDLLGPIEECPEGEVQRGDDGCEQHGAPEGFLHQIRAGSEQEDPKRAKRSAAA